MNTDIHTADGKGPVAKPARLALSVWATTFILVAMIVGVVAFGLARSYQKALESAHDTAGLNGHLVSEWLAESLYNIEYLLHDIANTVENSSDLVRLQVTPFTSPFNQQLRRRAGLDSNVLFLGVNAADGTLVYSSIESLLGGNAKDLNRDYYASALETPQNQFKVSNAFISSTSQINVTATYPVFNPENELIGFSLAGLDLSFFQRWLNRIDEPSVTISIIDEKKTLLARKPVSDQIGQPMTIPLLDKFMESGQQSGKFRLLSPLDSADRLWSIRRIRGLPFVVAVGYSTDHALAGWYTELFASIVGTLIIFIVSVLLAKRYLANIHLLGQLQTALSEVKTLSGLLPICSYCKKIRDDQGYWTRIEEYIDARSDAKFSHGICEDCLNEHFPDLAKKVGRDNRPSSS